MLRRMVRSAPGRAVAIDSLVSAKLMEGDAERAPEMLPGPRSERYDGEAGNPLELV